jgi:predicted enzyme related to lactoylglutathione lyase
MQSDRDHNTDGSSNGDDLKEDGWMGILTNAIPIGIICVRDRERAKPFYRDVLGLDLVHEDAFAAVFEVGGMSVRLSTVPGFTPHEHTVFGFRVPDIEAAVKALAANGVSFNRYEGFKQDALGIWAAPGGAVRVAWFKDPDGNVLSVTQFG